MSVLCLGVLALGNAALHRATFVFDNQSGTPAIVSYTVKDKLESPASTVPAIARSASGEGGWRELGTGEYLASSDGRTRTIEVKAGESLRIAVVERYPGHGLKGLWTFPVSSLQVAHTRSSTAVSWSSAGCEALLAFERRSDSLYVRQVRRGVVVTPTK